MFLVLRAQSMATPFVQLFLETVLVSLERFAAFAALSWNMYVLYVYVSVTVEPVHLGHCHNQLNVQAKPFI